MRKASRCSKQSGFTIFEILVAMVLLASIGAMAYSSFTSAMQVTQSDSNTAYNVARGHLERFFEYVRQDQYAAGTPSPVSLAGRPAPANQVLQGVTFVSTYTLNGAAGVAAALDLDGDGMDDYRRVTMTVAW